MGRAAVRIAELVGIVALLSVLACGGSSASQRDDEVPVDDGVGEGESADDSSPPDQTDAADESPGNEQGGDDPVEQALADGGETADGGSSKASNKSERKFKTSESPEKLSEFLVKPAKQAMKDKDYPLAISLYSGLVAARGKGDESARQLATAWTLAGQMEEAAEVYEAFAANTDNDEKRVEAKAEAERLREFETPFDREYRPKYSLKHAAQAHKLGRKAQKKKKWADALFYFEVAAAIDPTLAGPIREIATCYKELGAPDDAKDFFLDYLWRKPAGKFTKTVLDELKKLKKSKELGYLNVESKMPCEEVWVEGQRVKGLPIKKKPMAPGPYRWLCYSGRYGMAYFKRVNVEKGKTKTLEFTWAVVVDKLQNPWGRIRLEDPRKPGTLKYIGNADSYKEYGVIVPGDGSALQMQLEDPSFKVIDKRFVRIKPGEKFVVTWKKK